MISAAKKSSLTKVNATLMIRKIENFNKALIGNACLPKW